MPTSCNPHARPCGPRRRNHAAVLTAHAAVHILFHILVSQLRLANGRVLADEAPYQYSLSHNRQAGVGPQSDEESTTLASTCPAGGCTLGPPEPVCGSDGLTYASACLAACQEVSIVRSGACSAVEAQALAAPVATAGVDYPTVSLDAMKRFSSKGFHFVGLASSDGFTVEPPNGEPSSRLSISTTAPGSSTVRCLLDGSQYMYLAPLSASPALADPLEGLDHLLHPYQPHSAAKGGQEQWLPRPEQGEEGKGLSPEPWEEEDSYDEGEGPPEEEDEESGHGPTEGSPGHRGSSLPSDGLAAGGRPGPGDVEGAAVIPVDSRIRRLNTRNRPWRRMAQLVLQNANANHAVFLCSGAVVGRRWVLTAAHCVWSDSKVVATVTVTPGKSGDEVPFGQWKADLVQVLSQYKNGDGSYDMALVRFRRNAQGQYPGDVVGWMAAQASDRPYNGLAHTAGYPGDKPSGTMWSTSCPVRTGPVEGRGVAYVCDTFAGQSGSPIWKLSGINRYIIGVHSGFLGCDCRTKDTGKCSRADVSGCRGDTARNKFIFLTGFMGRWLGSYKDT